MNRRDLLQIVVATGPLSAVDASAQQTGTPFSIHTRPMPQGEDLNVLLPAKVGSFVRDELPTGAKLKSDEDLNIDYRSGSSTVNFGISKSETVADAREAIKVSRDEAVASKIAIRDAKYSLKTDPAYFHVGDFIAWTRGTYFMYAKASSPQVLAQFMATFPY
jgi:hypothetical protein